MSPHRGLVIVFMIGAMFACDAEGDATACELPAANGGLQNPDSTIVAFPHLTRPEVISEDMYTGWIAVRPGGVIPVHSHSSEHEIVFITCGGGEGTVDGSPIPLAAGTVMHARPGEAHGANAGERGLVGVQIYRPGAPGLRFYDWPPMGDPQ